MQSLSELIFGPTMPPHGHCYLWDNNLVGLHVTSDAIITLSYFTIPVALVYLVKKREDLSFNYMFLLFAVFIFACGATHLVNIWNVWHGAYWLSGTVKAITAIASIGTAILVWPLIPKALDIPSSSQLIWLNDQLRAEANTNLRQSQEMEALSNELAATVAQRNEELEHVRRLQQKLETQNRRLKESNDGLQQFAHVASHDLKEPLRTISSFGMLLKRKADNLGEQEEGYLDFMIDAASRMSQLVEDLRDYTVIAGEAPEPSNVDLDGLAQNVFRDLEQRIKDAGVTINYEKLPVIDGHGTHLNQLLLNLVNNAIKFSRDSIPPLVNIGPLRNNSGSEIGFYVRDNGIGISKEQQERIFGIFERLHGRDEFEGTGIGLAICQKVVEQHNGRIKVMSTPGEGAEFQVWFKQNT